MKHSSASLSELSSLHGDGLELVELSMDLADMEQSCHAEAAGLNGDARAVVQIWLSEVRSYLHVIHLLDRTQADAEQHRMLCELDDVIPVLNECVQQMKRLLDRPAGGGGDDDGGPGIPPDNTPPPSQRMVFAA